MTIWIDAQISPDVARWLTNRFNVEALHVKDLQMVEATDPTIFDAARIADAVVLTKDRDFVELVRRRGVPPRVIWITCGNTSTRELTLILEATFQKAWALLASGEPVVEIRG
jgi:predicted nuclease of predicted toxin-antitoxin system